MIRKLLMGIALIAAVGFHASAMFMPAFGRPAGEIAARLPVVFMPSIYSTLILIVLVPLLGLYVLRGGGQADRPSTANLRAALFIAASILHIIELITWQEERFVLFTASEVAMLAVLAALYFTYPKKENRLSGRVPISGIFSYFFFSLLVAIHYTLEENDWGGLGLSDALWAIITLTFAAAAALHFLYHHKDDMFAGVFVWMSLMVAARNGLDEPLVSAASLFLAGAVITWMIVSRRQGQKAPRTAED
ncbi:hypothetical protein C772_02574 [Bhargavaea cecembensis DSE10]|uniref:Uncharacterized protein n=1 Tax=Bhargavaea cecembensis DSE10 TaxID=1235279 RepID=M7NE46_9BACL|nr:hypothetical protein [Bhargavaea cecembensis]EMR05466.1 hypothetical protein C772_02574 [Bhargavaea cecembensis DSE10]